MSVSIITPNKYTNLTYEDSKGNKKLLSIGASLYAGYLFTIWKNGKYEWRDFPDENKQMEDTGLSRASIYRYINELKQSKWYDDRAACSYSILKVGERIDKNDGTKRRTFKLSIPGVGELTDPSEFTQDGGGSATMSAIGGYLTVSSEIIKSNLTIMEKLVLSAWKSLVSSKANSKWIFYRSSLGIAGILVGREETAAKVFDNLRNKGYISTKFFDIKDPRKGFVNVKVSDNPELNNDVSKKVDETEMETEADAINEIEDMIKEDEGESDKGTVDIDPSDGVLIGLWRNDLEQNNRMIQRLESSGNKDDVSRYIIANERLVRSLKGMYAKYGKVYK